MNKKIQSYLLIAYILAILLGPFIGIHVYDSWRKRKRIEAYKEKWRNDSIRKAFVRDSLKNDPRYQDSLRREEEEFEKWKREEEEFHKKEINGYMLAGDSIYHTSFHSLQYSDWHAYGFLVEDKARLVFLTSEEIETQSYRLCEDCEKTENVRIRYEDGELFDDEGVFDHDFIKREDADDYCSHNRY